MVSIKKHVDINLHNLKLVIIQVYFFDCILIYYNLNENRYIFNTILQLLFDKV